MNKVLNKLLQEELRVLRLPCWSRVDATPDLIIDGSKLPWWLGIESGSLEQQAALLTLGSSLHPPMLEFLIVLFL